MPEPTAPRTPPVYKSASMAGAWALAACFLMSNNAELRYRGLRLPPKAVERLEARSFSDPMVMRVVGAGVVMPFADVTVAKTDVPGPVRQARPQPVRREAGGLVCQLGDQANLLGTVDGRALAKAWADYVGRTGLVYTTRYIENPNDLHGEATLFRGRVLEAVMRVAENGAREYRLEVEISASVLYDGYPPVRPPFWTQVVRVVRRAGVRPAEYEIGDLLQEAFAEAAKGLAAAM
jgi:hypothetical protein